MSTIQMIQITPQQLAELIATAVKEQFNSLKDTLSNSKENTLLTRQETASFLKINLSTLSNWCRKGRIPSYGIEGRVYFKMSDINSALVQIKN